MAVLIAFPFVLSSPGNKARQRTVPACLRSLRISGIVFPPSFSERPHGFASGIWPTGSAKASFAGGVLDIEQRTAGRSLRFGDRNGADGLALVWTRQSDCRQHRHDDAGRTTRLASNDERARGIAASLAVSPGAERCRTPPVKECQLIDCIVSRPCSAIKPFTAMIASDMRLRV